MEIRGVGSVVSGADVGNGTVIWHYCNLYGCRIGEDCTVGSYVEIGKDVVIGDSCKIQSFAFIPSGVLIGDRVFVGPNATFTNDRIPRAQGTWDIVRTIIEDGASIGAGAVILCGVKIGSNAIVGAGSVVTKDVESNTIVVGNPAEPLRKC